MAKLEVIPGKAYSNALDVLRSMFERSDSIRAAVAFVTKTGVDEIEALMPQRSDFTFELIARGAPITDPRALVRLSELGVKVRVVIGSKAMNFHPKLWIARSGDSLEVLSGSGNLTHGGLESNAEQFEYICLTEPSDSKNAEFHQARWDGFRMLSVSLGSVQGMPYWEEWEQQITERGRISAEQRELDRQLFSKAGDADQLYLDLLDLYERTKREVKMTRSDGVEVPYVPTRFKQQIDRANMNNALVPTVAKVVKESTSGFDHLEKAGRPDLCVESLVLDESKPYHRLFSREAISASKARMDSFGS